MRRDRAILPIVIPIGVLVFVFVFLAAMRFVLLTVQAAAGKITAALVALSFALLVLAVCTVLSRRDGGSSEPTHRH